MATSLRTLDDLTRSLAAHGASRVHADAVVRAWLHGRDLTTLPESSGARLPLRLRDALGRVGAGLAGLVREVGCTGDDAGTVRRVLRLDSGRTIESVDLPRDGLCVSSQVGCAVGCTFCRTGRDGRLQQLSPLEILAQVAHARRERSVRRVVFMGMGEPSHNLGAVVEAVRALGTHGGLGHKNVVVSTVGAPRVFDRLQASPVRPALALSLHTLDAGLRRSLAPGAPRIDPAVLLDAALDYAERTGYPLQVQWALLDGLNDSDREARRLARRLRGRRAIVNYIPFNDDGAGGGHRRPPLERCVAVVRALRAGGGIATLRFSAGQRIEAGCGQLRTRIASPP